MIRFVHLLTLLRVPCFAFPLLLTGSPLLQAQEVRFPKAKVPRCTNFEISGQGDNEHWQKADWINLHQRPNGKHDYSARVKMLASDTGVYVLFNGTDQLLTATMAEDFANLWTEDVYECFFWTDESQPIYFEYEISPLGYELPILVPNNNGNFLGWRPWNYHGDRKIQKKVSTSGGAAKSMATVAGWTAEVFIPYALLKPLGNVPPKSGTTWRANFYRVDYDHDQTTAWDWSRVGPSFHEYQKFGKLTFE